MPTPDAPSLDPRAAAAQSISQLVRDHDRYGDDVDDPFATVTLLLQDLLSYCDHHGMEFAKCERAAREGYREEVVGPTIRRAGALAPAADAPLARPTKADFLLRAVTFGSSEDLATALKGVADVPSDGVTMVKALGAAVERGEAFAVRQLLDRGVAPTQALLQRNATLLLEPRFDAPGADGEAKRRDIEVLLRCALFAAAQNLPFRAPVQGRLDDWTAPELLFLGACESGDPEALEEVVQSEIPEPRRECLGAGLVRACAAGNRRIADDLLETWPDILDERAENGTHRDTALVAATRGKHEQLALRLLGKGAAADVQNGTAVILAAKHGMGSLLRELVVTRGVHPSSAGGGGPLGRDFALYQCAISGDRPGMEMLLAHGADPRSAQALAAGRVSVHPEITARLRAAVEDAEAQEAVDKELGFDNALARTEGWELDGEFRVRACPSSRRPYEHDGEIVPRREAIADDMDALIHVQDRAAAGGTLHAECLAKCQHGAGEIRVAAVAASLKSRGYKVPPGAVGRAIAAAEEGIAVDRAHASAGVERSLGEVTKEQWFEWESVLELAEAVCDLVAERQHGAEPARPRRR